jgi:hypothetical protein
MIVSKEEEGAEGVAGGRLGPEAVALAMELGFCPGRECPHAQWGCDPRCPALRVWVEEVSGG